MNLTIHHFELSEPEMLVSCITRVKLFTAVKDADIHCCKRLSDGWLKYILVLRYTAGGLITIGAVQRTPNASVEFHS